MFLRVLIYYTIFYDILQYLDILKSAKLHISKNEQKGKSHIHIEYGSNKRVYE